MDLQQQQEQLTEQLMSLGLTRYEAAAYLALLGRHGFTPAQAAARSGVPRQRIYDVLASLAAQGLCIEGHGGQQRIFRAVDPAAALPAMLDAQRRQREAEQARQQTLAETLIGALGPAFSAGSDLLDPLDYVDVLLERRRVGERAVGLAREARHEILACFRWPLIASIDENMAEVRDPLGRGVRYRALYERSLFDDPQLRHWVRQFVAWGQEARVVAELPIKVNLFDERIALLSLQDPVTGTPSFTALCVRHPDFVRMLTIAFEGMWAQGEPVGKVED